MMTMHDQSDMPAPALDQDDKQQETQALLSLIKQGRQAFLEGKYGDAKTFLDEMDDCRGQATSTDQPV